MKRGKLWIRAAQVISIVCGFAGERVCRALDLVPPGWGWSVLVYMLCGAFTFCVLVVVLTKTGR